MSSKNKDKETRTRNWTIVVYPDSAPENWRDIIDEWHIEWVESPIHDKDMNADGTPKKAHWHVLLMFGSVKAYEQVIELIEPLNCPIPKKCHNAKSLVRYMAHLDNPDKVQYDSAAIVAHGGVCIADLLKPSSSERYTYIREMCEWCNENDCTEFMDLMNYAMVERMEDWFPLLCDNSSYVMTQFLKSKRHAPCKMVDNYVTDADGVTVDTITGEIVCEHE